MLCLVSFVRAESLPVSIAPNDAKLYYVGRFDLADAKGPRFEWSNSRVTVRFSGTDLQMRLRDSGKNYYAVEIDNAPAVTIKGESGEHVIDLARNLKPGEHTVTIVRRTESHCGTAQIQGFLLNAGGELLEPKRQTRKIEVIGDSISCGYGVDSADKSERYSPEKQNAYMTYGAIASRALDAEYVCLAWSGKKLHPNNTLPEIYGRTRPLDKNSTWDFSQWTPDVVLINLATNDFGKETPEEEGWVGAYKAFIQRIRTNYPKAPIYITTSPMMYGAKQETLKKYLNRVVADLGAEDVKDVRVLEFATQNVEKDGTGGDWHPNAVTNQKMAKVFLAALKRDLGWEAAH